MKQFYIIISLAVHIAAYAFIWVHYDLSHVVCVLALEWAHNVEKHRFKL